MRTSMTTTRSSFAPDSVPADQAGRFQRVFSGDVNVCWFRRPRPTTMSMILSHSRRPIDWSEGRGGGVIRVPPGAYVCNNVVLKNGVHAVFDSSGLRL
ncbi:MAG: hypothetical protein WDN29_03480 [Methylovirgula sp.]